jgi:hypothetical protein
VTGKRLQEDQKVGNQGFLLCGRKRKFNDSYGCFLCLLRYPLRF